MRNRYTIEFLGTWEMIHNPGFKVVEFDHFRKQAGLPSFVLSASEWIESTNAIGIVVRKGRYGGTYAYKDIAFEFGTAISVPFKLYLIEEFQRLKEQEQARLGWSAKRELSKINYRIHTDAIKHNLVPSEVTPQQANRIYASEADVLNVALFGMTAAEWREALSACLTWRASMLYLSTRACPSAKGLSNSIRLLSVRCRYWKTLTPVFLAERL